MAAVVVAVLPDEPDLRAEIVFLFEVDENYSLENVRRRFVKANRDIFGDEARAYEIARFKSVKKLLAWADRKGKNRHGLPPLTGWYGPIRLKPMTERR